MVLLSQISAALIKMDYPGLKQLILSALEEGQGAEKIMTEGLFKGMEVVGERFKEGELFIPEVLGIAKGLQQSMDILSPQLIRANIKASGRVVIGTVKGDLHDMGKNIVKMMFEGAGLKVFDLGVDVSAESFLEAVKSKEPQILALSALLTTTMSYMKVIVDSLNRVNLRNRVKIIVGGAPITQQFADSIGADGYAPDAIVAVERVRQWA